MAQISANLALSFELRSSEVVMNVLFFLLIHAIMPTTHADPPLTPESLCAGIRSSKYEAQCKSAIRNKHFNMAALRICSKERDGYDKKSCVEVIADRVYTPEDLKACLAGEKMLLHMCLLKSGTPYVAPVEQPSGSNPTES